MMWEAPRVKLWVRMMMVNVMMWAVVTRTGNFAAAARLVGDGVAKGQKVKEAALELTTADFNTTLLASPAPLAIVEFYLHYCSACMLFKPKYEKVAKLFNGPDAVYPGVLLMYKVDCAEKINSDLCLERFSVKRYPTILWGKPATISMGSRVGEKDTDIVDIKQLTIGQYNAEALLDQINKRLQTTYSLDPSMQKQQLLELSNSKSGQMSLPIYDIEEATAQAYDIILDTKFVTSRHRAPFVQFLQLLVAHHPSRKCRAGSAQILVNLTDAWPSEYELERLDDHVINEGSEMLADVASLRQLHICGEGLPSETYTTCTTETGGFSCGLWYLFHALSVRVDDSESNAAMKTICGFVANFFPCEECRVHFLEMSQNATETVSSRRNLTLWLWRAHNEVNYRLFKEADVLTQSSRFQWPSKAICAICRKGPETTHENADEEIEWNEEDVLKFLKNTYGNSILTVAEDRQTSGNKGDETVVDEAQTQEHKRDEPVVGKAQTQGIKRDETVADETRTLGKSRDGAVQGKEENVTTSVTRFPIGAGVGIAMVASCCFGIAACCWRVQPKRKRKIRRM